MLIGADIFLSIFSEERTCWIRGIKGGGKTSLAFYIAHLMMKPNKLRYVISNVESIWSENLSDITLRDNKYLDAIVILDEGGRFLRGRNVTEQFLDFCRKFNLFWICPSVSEPYRMMQKLQVQPVWDFQKTLGIDMGLYRWAYKDGTVTEKGKFLWRSRRDIYGIYSTETGNLDDMGILDWIIEARDKSSLVKKGASKALQRASGNNNFILEILDMAEEVSAIRESQEGSEALSRNINSKKKV